MKKRFSKASLIQDLYNKSEEIKSVNNLTTSTGTHQLTVGQPKKIQALILRAVEYGRMIELKQVYEDIDSGHLGTGSRKGAVLS